METRTKRSAPWRTPSRRSRTRLSSIRSAPRLWWRRPRAPWRRGIPVILCANGIESDNFVTRVDIDLYQAGYQAADGLAKSLNGTGNVIMFSGIAGVDAAETWKKAAEDAFKQYPGIKVVASEYAQWSVATSKEKTAAIMAANPQIDGVWAGGGEMALGAALAFQDAGKPQPK